MEILIFEEQKDVILKIKSFFEEQKYAILKMLKWL
jgi:hypothetical protein